MSENPNNKQMLHEWVASGQTQSENQSQQQEEQPSVSSTYDRNKVTISPHAFVADSMAKNSRQLLYAHIYNYMLNNGHYESAMTFLKEADVPVSADSPGFTLGRNDLLQTKVLMDSPNTFLLQWWNTMWHLNEFVEKQPLEYITNMRPFIDVIAPIMPIKQGPPQPPQPPQPSQPSQSQQPSQPPHHANHPQYNQRLKKDPSGFFLYPFQGPISSATQTPTTPLATSFNNRQSQYTPNGPPGNVRGSGPSGPPGVPGSNMTDPNGPPGYANTTQPNGYFASRSGAGAAPYQHHHNQQQQTSAKNTPNHEQDISSTGAGPQYAGHPHSNMNGQHNKPLSAYQQYQQQFPAQHPYKQQHYGQPPQGYPSQQQYDAPGYPLQQVLSKSSLETQFGSSQQNKQSGPAFENRGSIDNGRLEYEGQRQQRDMMIAGNTPQMDPHGHNNNTHGMQQNFYGKPVMNQGSPPYMHSPHKKYGAKTSPTGSQVSSTKEKKAVLAQVGRQKPINRPSPVGNSVKLNHIPEEGYNDHHQPVVDGNGPVQGYDAKVDGNYYPQPADKNTNSSYRFYQPPPSSTLNNGDNNIGQKYTTGNSGPAASPSPSVKSASSRNRAKKSGNVASTPVPEEEMGQEKPTYRFGNPEQQKFQLDQRHKAIKAQQQYQQLVLQQQLQKQTHAGGVDHKGVVSNLSTPGNMNTDGVPRDPSAEFSAPPQSGHSGQPTPYQNIYYNNVSGSASAENIDSMTQQKMYSGLDNTGRPGTQKTPASTGAVYTSELGEPPSVHVAAPGKVVKSKGAKKKTGALLSPAVQEDEQPSEASVFEQTMADPFLMQDFNIDALSGSRPVSVHDVVGPGARGIGGPHAGDDNMLDTAAGLTKSVLHDTDLNDEDFYKSGVDLFQLDNVSGDFMHSAK